MQNNKSNLTDLVETLIDVDSQDYDHPLLYKLFNNLANLDVKSQDLVIENALNYDLSYNELMDHIRMQFIVLKQLDQKGKYCGLGYGDKCVSVGTWDTHDLPKNMNDMDIISDCYTNSNNELRCGHLINFVELWMEVNNKSFDEFLSGLKTKTSDTLEHEKMAFGLGTSIRKGVSEKVSAAKSSRGYCYTKLDTGPGKKMIFTKQGQKNFAEDKQRVAKECRRGPGGELSPSCPSRQTWQKSIPDCK